MATPEAPVPEAKAVESQPTNQVARPGSHALLTRKFALRGFCIFLLPCIIGLLILIIIGLPEPPEQPPPVKDYKTAVFFWDRANKSMTHVTMSSRNCFHPQSSDFEAIVPRQRIVLTSLQREHDICLVSGAKEARRLAEEWRRTPNYSLSMIPLLLNISAIAESCAWSSNMAWHLLVESELAILARWYVQVGDREEVWNKLWQVTRWRPRFGGKMCDKCRDVPISLNRKFTLIWLRGLADAGRDGHEAWRFWLELTLDGLKRAIDKFIDEWDPLGVDEGRERVDMFMREWLGQS